jgi:hypothetical protein
MPETPPVASPLLIWMQTSTLAPSPGSPFSSARCPLPHRHRRLAGACRHPNPVPHLAVGDPKP